MQLQCECGKFRAELKSFPKESPGLLKCYCDDCQSYLHYLKRADLLDQNGGTEIVPNYPRNVRITQGREFVKCTRLSAKGMYRFATTCCNTPICNTAPDRPWMGLSPVLFKATKEDLGPIRSSIMGKYAHGETPKGTPKTFDFNGFKIVMPFVIKGKLLGKAHPSPMFENDQKTPIVKPKVLTIEERTNARKTAGV